MSSRQQDDYLRYRFVDKLNRNTASFRAGILWAEGEMIDEAVKRGEIEIPAAGVAASERQGESIMARPKKDQDENIEREDKKDFARASKIYRNDIKPAVSKAAEFMQESSTAYKAIKKECSIQPSAAKFVFKLVEMEDSKRDDFLRCVEGLMAEMGIDWPHDLMDMAEGKAAPADRPQLATVQ